MAEVGSKMHFLWGHRMGLSHPTLWPQTSFQIERDHMNVVQQWSRDRLRTALNMYWFGHDVEAQELLARIVNVVVKEPYNHAKKEKAAPAVPAEKASGKPTKNPSSTREGRDQLATSDDGPSSGAGGYTDGYGGYVHHQFNEFSRPQAFECCEPTRWREESDTDEGHCPNFP